MYLKDAILLLQQNLPMYSDKFTEQKTIASISYAAGKVTVVTTTAHGLTTNEYINIVGAFQQTTISDITTVDGVATVTTSIDHDLTMDYAIATDQPPIVIAGCSIGAYNGSHTLLDVIDRNTFTFNIGGSPAQANDGYLEENSIGGYSGLKQITVINTTTFEFTPVKTPAPSCTNGVVHYGN